MIRCSRSFSKYGSHLNRDTLTRKYRSNAIDISCSGIKRLTLCILENSFGNLGSVHPIFNEEKILEKLGGVLFQNAKKINLEVLCHQFRVYGRDFRDLLELFAFTSREDSTFCISAFRKAVFTIY